ncbi:MAG: SdpI family protein [Eubacteriales bacterium]|nr:SdpI family protein [Eubacteriales bacterium]
MKSRNLRIANYVLAVCCVLLTAVLYPFLPGRVPIHWDISGAVSYGPKAQIFLLCGMSAVFAGLFDLLPRIDPRRKHYEKFGKYYDWFCILMQLFLLIMTGVVLVESFRPGTLSVPVVVMLCVGLLFLFLGNIMPKVKSNFYIGFRTPWALSSEENWRRTHRLGGKCFFVSGVVTLLSCFIPDQTVAFWLVMIALLVSALIPTVMSYVWYRKG